MTILTRLLYPFTSPEARRIAKLIRANPAGLHQCDDHFRAWSLADVRVGIHTDWAFTTITGITVSWGNAASNEWSWPDSRLLHDEIGDLSDALKKSNHRFLLEQMKH